jgi:N-carbamoyl-L-amino-acid hydrolase
MTGKTRVPGAIRGAELERIKDDWMLLSDYRDAAAPGWTRMAFSEPDTEARHVVAELMRRAGLQVECDAVGNVIGHLEGSDPHAGLLVTGSHTDTVEGGGRFDGVVGVLGAIEAVRVLRESGVELRHSLRVVDFSNEEPNAHGLSCVGSRAIAGTLDASMLAFADTQGRALSDRIAAAGWEPERFTSCRWPAGEVDAYVELHIEQGPVLEATGASVGVVTRIAGISRFVLEIAGRCDHAGTMSMAQRHDALCTAAAATLAVERIATAGSESVGTVGELLIAPDAVNVVADQAHLSGEFRSPDDAWLVEAGTQFADAVAEECEKRGTDGAVAWRPREEPVTMDGAVSDALATAAQAGGHDAVRLFSGAGHDTVQMARICPTGMIFIPSIGGRSHCPEENTEFDDVRNGVDTLIRGLVELDAQ